MADDAAPAAASYRPLVAVIVVFALGTVFGAALVFGVIIHLPWARAFIHPPHGEHGGPAGIERLIRDLDLDPDQEARFRAIVEKTHGEMGASLERAHQAVLAILRPDQQKTFEKIRPHGPPFPHMGHGPHGPGHRPEGALDQTPEHDTAH